jgi:hypothetical protein
MNLKKFKIDFKSIKKGDKVYSLVHGDLFFIKITLGNTYPVVCRRGKSGTEYSFSMAGKERSGEKNQTLFKSNPFLEIEKIEASNVFIPKVMEVSDNNVSWYEKYVVHCCEMGTVSVSASEFSITSTVWKYSREVQEKQDPLEEFTLEELAKLAGKNPELIRLKS